MRHIIRVTKMLGIALLVVVPALASASDKIHRIIERNPPPPLNWCNCGPNAESTLTVTVTYPLGRTFTGVCGSNGKCVTVPAGQGSHTESFSIPSGQCLDYFVFEEDYLSPVLIDCTSSAQCPNGVTVGIEGVDLEPRFSNCTNENNPGN